MVAQGAFVDAIRFVAAVAVIGALVTAVAAGWTLYSPLSWTKVWPFIRRMVSSVGTQKAHEKQGQANRIAADHADCVDLREKACRQSKVRSRTAKDLVPFSKRGFQRVKRDRTYNC